MPSKIEWCDETINPVIGCSKISAGCDHCFAEKMACRLSHMDVEGYDEVINYAGKWNGRTAFIPSQLKKPMKWKKPRWIFVGSMTDMFHESVPFEWVHQVWDMMKACPQHTFLVLTKRPDRMAQLVNQIYRMERMGASMGFWKHVYLGVTAENQEQADIRIPVLLSIPASVRFVSVEPMLGTVSLRRKAADDREIVQATLMGQLDEYSRSVQRGLDWIICGGESGPGARPMHPDWVRGLRDQCAAAGVPFFFKQWGEFIISAAADSKTAPMDAHEHNRHWPFYRVGKKKSGRLLDGVEHSAFPLTK